MEVSRKNHLRIQITVVAIAIIVSLINIAHVILGLARTPVNYVYMATGQYYLDYYVYLQYIAQGIRGQWLPVTNLTTDDQSIHFFRFPYIILGQIAGQLKLSPVSAYWIAVFILTAIFIMLMFVALKRITANHSVYFVLGALLIGIFSSPFYKLINKNGSFSFIPYEYWYGPGTIIGRFGVVPYHILSSLLILSVLIYTGRYLETTRSESFSGILKKSLIPIITIVFLITFSPFNVVTLLLTLICSLPFYLKDRPKLRILAIYLTIMMVLVIPFGIVIKNIYGNYEIFKRISNLEVGWQEKISWLYGLANLGPMVLLFPLGLVSYLRKLKPLKILLLLYALLTYVLVLSPLAVFLKTQNLRFLSPINYIFFGVLTVLGIEKLTQLLRLPKRFFMTVIFVILMAYFSILNFYYLNRRIQLLDPYTPVTNISYLPKTIIAGLNSLNKQSEPGAVLTGPYQFIGMVVPVFSNRRVYIGRPIETVDFEKKSELAGQFYSGKMVQAGQFVRQKGIKFVVITAIDGFGPEGLLNYSFLKEIYKNNDMIIFKVI